MMQVAVRWMLVGALLLSFDAAADGVDVRLVIDVSGSMKSGDPEYLRQDVLNGLGEILPPGSRAGVWTFGRMADVVVPHGAVDDAWRRSARAARMQIGSAAPRTNLNDALRNAAWDIADPSSEYDRHIVLVSDGRVDVADDAASNDAQRRAITDELVPRLRAAGIRIDCLVLSEKADLDFLKRIADETQGHIARADTVAAVKEYLVTALGGIAAAGSFSIAADTAEVTVFADRAHDTFVLTSPSGERIDSSTKTDGITWFDADAFSIATIKTPAAGTWRFAPPAARIQIWDQLGIAIRPDDAVEAPAVRIELTQAGKPIDEPRLAELVAITAELKTLYGIEPLQVTTLDGTPQTYAVDLGGMPLTAADQVTVHVDGKTFERSRVYTERIAHPIDVDIRGTGEGDAGALVRVNVADLDPASLRVLGSTRTAGGRVKLVVGTKQSDGAWLVAIPRLEHHVDVRLKVLFNLLNNQKIEAESDPISLTLPLAEPVSVGLDIDGHIVVDPVRPPPVVATPPSSDAQIEAPVEAAVSAPLEPTPEATPVPVGVSRSGSRSGASTRTGAVGVDRNGGHRARQRGTVGVVGGSFTGRRASERARFDARALSRDAGLGERKTRRRGNDLGAFAAARYLACYG